MKTMTHYSREVATILLTSTVVLASCSSDDNSVKELETLQIVDQNGNAFADGKIELTEGEVIPFRIIDSKGALVQAAKLQVVEGKDIVTIDSDNTITGVKEGNAVLAAIADSNYKISTNLSITVKAKTEIELSDNFAKAITAVLGEKAPKAVSGNIFKKSDLEKIEILYMNHDEMGYNGTKYALKNEDLNTLKYFTSLRVLEINYHTLAEDVVLEVPASLEDLSMGRYNNQSIKTISIKGAKELRMLDLFNNNDLKSIDLNGSLVGTLNVNRCYAIKENLFDIVSKTQPKELYANVLGMEGDLTMNASRLELLEIQDHKFKNVNLNAPKLVRINLNSEDVVIQDINLSGSKSLNRMSVDYLDIQGKLGLADNSLTGFQANRIKGLKELDLTVQTNLETILVIPAPSLEGKLTLDLRFCSKLLTITDISGCNVELIEHEGKKVLDYSRLDSLDDDYGKIVLSDVYNYDDIEELWVNKKYEGQLNKYYAIGSNKITVKYITPAK
ncbi:hypothetical protein [Myroides odoratimimus]|uniref:hypothetical protein n=1 Tax=Myroides odoratimimus TaxID=76832 RepID=UPI00310127A9